MKKGLIKKICSFALAGVMAMSLAACGSGNSTAEKDKLDQIKENKTFVVGLSADYAPYEFHAMVDGKDTVVGFDVELAKEIAKDMGVELKIQEMEFDALLSALKADQIDAIISGMNPDEERKKEIDFSDIYYEAQHGVLVKEENKDKFTKVEDLAGKNIGAQLGSTQQKIAEEQANAGNLQLLSNVNNLVLELKTGKIDALITEEPVAKMAMKNNPEVVLSDIKFPSEGGGNAVGIKKGSTKLVEQINSTIKRLQESGDLDKFIIEANDLAAQNQEQ